MPILVAENPDVEVSGLLLLALLESDDFGVQMRKRIFENNGINTVNAESWHPIQPTLDIQQELETEFGERALWQAGLNSFKKLPLALDMTRDKFSFRDLLEQVNTMMAHLHRGESPGEYELVEEDLQRNTVTIRTNTPYSNAFQKGNMVGAVRAGTDAFDVSVELAYEDPDDDKQRRFRMSW